MPKENEKDLVEVPEEVRGLMDIHFAETIDEVLALALEEACPIDETATTTEEAKTPPLWTTEPPPHGVGTPAE